MLQIPEWKTIITGRLLPFSEFLFPYILDIIKQIGTYTLFLSALAAFQKERTHNMTQKKAKIIQRIQRGVKTVFSEKIWGKFLHEVEKWDAVTGVILSRDAWDVSSSFMRPLTIASLTISSLAVPSLAVPSPLPHSLSPHSLSLHSPSPHSPIASLPVPSPPIPPCSWSPHSLPPQGSFLHVLMAARCKTAVHWRWSPSAAITSGPPCSVLRVYSWLLCSCWWPTVPDDIMQYVPTIPTLSPPAAATLPPQLPFPKRPSPQRGSPPPAPHSLPPHLLAASFIPAPRALLPAAAVWGGRGAFSPLTRLGSPGVGARRPCGLRGQNGRWGPAGGEQSRPWCSWCGGTNLWGKGVERPVKVACLCTSLDYVLLCSPQNEKIR